jgi:hypothetical protein
MPVANLILRQERHNLCDPNHVDPNVKPMTAGEAARWLWKILSSGLHWQFLNLGQRRLG